MLMTKQALKAQLWNFDPVFFISLNPILVGDFGTVQKFYATFGPNTYYLLAYVQHMHNEQKLF